MPAVECGAIAKRMETDGAAAYDGGLLDGKDTTFQAQVRKIKDQCQ